MEFNLSTLYVYTLSQKFNRIRILSTSGCNKNLKTIERREEACKFDMHVSLTPHSFDEFPVLAIPRCQLLLSFFQYSSIFMWFRREYTHFI